MELKQPTAKQIETILVTFEKVLPKAQKKRQFDIFECKVNQYGHVCGTVHCVGGWYAVAACDLSKHVDYIHGASQMANDLGFISLYYFRDFFRQQPNLWGNDNGYYMFSNQKAYTPGNKRKASSLRDVYDHWVEVWMRFLILEEFEKYNKE